MLGRSSVTVISNLHFTLANLARGMQAGSTKNYSDR
jgi:hypothetical protein